MPSAEGASNPYAEQRERVRQALQARRDEQDEQSRRQQQRRDSINQFIQDFPPPPSFGPAERDEWTTAATDIAASLFPEDLAHAPGPADVDFRGIDDHTGATFLALRADRIFKLRERLVAVRERQNTLADEIVWWSTPRSTSPRGADGSAHSVTRPATTDGLSDDDLAGLDVEQLKAQEADADALVGYFEDQIRDLKLVGPRGLGSARAPVTGGRSASRDLDSGNVTATLAPAPHAADRAPSQPERNTGAADGSGLHSTVGASTKSAIERRRHLAEDLRYKLGVANHDLRTKHLKDGKRHVTVKELAKQIGRHPSYLSTRAKRLEIDLEPYKLLGGPRIFDPLMVIEKT